MNSIQLLFIVWLMSGIFHIMGFPTGIVLQTVRTGVYGFIPGYLLWHLISDEKHFMKTIAYSVGISLSFLMFGGLAINYLLPLIGIYAPLSPVPVLVAMNSLILALFILSLRYGHSVQTFCKEDVLSETISFRWVTIVSLPIVLAIFGTFLLNNGGPPWLSVASLAVIGIMNTVVLVRQRKTGDGLIGTVLFVTAVSLLLMLSVRSWHISGSDIHDELSVFRFTLQYGRWFTDSINRAYNACLSITILPTLLTSLTGIPDEYVYKFMYPVIFGFIAPVLYLLYRSFAGKTAAFLAVIYLVIQPFFIKPMVSLARQEIAFFFFALTLLTLFTERNGNTRVILSVLFGLSVIVSHYTTAYTMLILYGAAYTGFASYRAVRRLVRKPVPHASAISGKYVFILFLFTQLWYSQLTASTDNLIGTIRESVKNAKGIFVSELKNQEVTQSLSLSSQVPINTPEKVNAYIREIEKKREKTNITLYSTETYKDFQPVVVRDDYHESHLPPRVTKTVFDIFTVTKAITKLYIVIGMLAIIIFANPLRKKPQFLIMCLAGSVLVALVMFHPTLSARYNLSRLYLHMLFLLSLPALSGMSLLFEKLRIKYGWYILAGSLGIVYFFYSGLSAFITGGETMMHLFNSGHDYDKFYTHQADIDAALWLRDNRDPNLLIHADVYGFLQLKSTADIQYISTVLAPQAFGKNAYVYARTTNILGDKVNSSFDGNDITYRFPRQFLDQQKNAVYSTGPTMIFQ